MLKCACFSDKIESAHWDDDWRDRKHAQIVGHDGSILEITRADEYIRIVALANPQRINKPFAVYWFRSIEHAKRPKTEFYLSERMPVYMSSANVSRIINRIMLGKGRPWWTWTVNSRLTAIVAMSAERAG
jgi:hypothetical protein